jgi:hypothetical protein
VAAGFPKRSCNAKKHDPKKLALGRDPGVAAGFSEKIQAAPKVEVKRALRANLPFGGMPIAARIGRHSRAIGSGPKRPARL